MKDKEKIAVIMVVNNLAKNGISMVIYNYCTNIELSKFDITVAAGNPIDPFYEREFSSRGIKLIELPNRKKSSIDYYKGLYSLLRKGEYDIFHIHGNSATVTPELFLAFLAGIKVRIMHSHNTTCIHMKMHKHMLPLFKRLCTAGFACGTEAGNWIFGERNFTVIPNGFDTKKFIFESRAYLKNQ